MYLFKIFFHRPYFLLIFFIIISCRTSENNSKKVTAKISETEEYEIKEIALTGEVSQAEAEISGLTWFGNYLILLPQYPFSSESTTGEIYKIHKSLILDFIEGKNINPIEPEKIKIYCEGLTKFNKSGSGYESIMFLEDEVYLTIEFEENNKMVGYIVKGKINKDADEIILDSSTLSKINSQGDIHNLSDETIFSFKNQIYTLYEANGKNVNSKPIAHKFDENLKSAKNVNFVNIEYRITDATVPENDGKFWAINYMYSGDWQDLKPAEDEEILKFGVGKSHKNSQNIERLLEFQISDTLIYRTGTPPIQIKLSSNGKGRNWEGVAKLENYGFLIITDYFPGTVLGYIKYVGK